MVHRQVRMWLRTRLFYYTAVPQYVPCSRLVISHQACCFLVNLEISWASAAMAASWAFIAAAAASRLRRAQTGQNRPWRRCGLWHRLDLLLRPNHIFFALHFNFFIWTWRSASSRLLGKQRKCWIQGDSCGFLAAPFWPLFFSSPCPRPVCISSMWLLELVSLFSVFGLKCGFFIFLVLAVLFGAK